MTPKLNQCVPPSKKTIRKSITLKEKVDILRRYDRGETNDDIRTVYPLGVATLNNIKKNREKIMAAVKAGEGSLIRIRSSRLQRPTIQAQQARTSGHIS